MVEGCNNSAIGLCEVKGWWLGQETVDEPVFHTDPLLR